MRTAVAYIAGNAHQQPHFLDSCYLCHKSLNWRSDIFMYRGDTPFCSPDCRQEQIDMDEAGESRWRMAAAKRVSSNHRISETSGQSDGKRSVRTGTLAVA